MFRNGEIIHEFQFLDWLANYNSVHNDILFNAVQSYMLESDYNITYC
jgi:hypothetical protein